LSGAGEVRVSVHDSVRNGLVRPGGILEAILTEAEKSFAANPPRSSVDAFDMLDQAAKTIDPSFAAGIPSDLQPVVAGQD
jgi:hypothetical protein